MKLLWDVRRLLMSFALRSSFSHDGSDGGENFSAGDFWCLAACPGIFFTTTCEHRLNLHYKQGAHLNGHLLLLAKRERRRPQFTNVTTYSNSSCLLLAPTAIWNVEKRNLLPYTLANVTFVFGVFFVENQWSYTTRPPTGYSALLRISGLIPQGHQPDIQR
jgi:hypothetical protein